MKESTSRVFTGIFFGMLATISVVVMVIGPIMVKLGGGVVLIAILILYWFAHEPTLFLKERSSPKKTTPPTSE